MDATLIAVAMHSLERIVAVLLGGLAVYYGFRLFLLLPVGRHPARRAAPRAPGLRGKARSRKLRAFKLRYKPSIACGAWRTHR